MYGRKKMNPVLAGHSYQIIEKWAFIWSLQRGIPQIQLDGKTRLHA
jgi:hypothetical protein